MAYKTASPHNYYNFDVMIKRSYLIIKPLLFCLVLFMMLTGCHKVQKFTTEKWDSGDGLNFPIRNSIVDDLLQNHKLKGLKYRQITHLLRYPQYMDSTRFNYEIIRTYTHMRKPDHIKNLIFYMDKNSVITKVELYDNQAEVKSKYF